MKKLNSLIAITLLVFIPRYGNSQCVSCNNNTVDFTKFASAVGQNNLSNAQASFAMGNASQAKGISSGAFGINSEAWAEASFAIGRKIRVIASSSIILGSGYLPSDYLINGIANTLMIGFNSTAPTFFVSESKDADEQHKDRTGRVAIGNMTAPQAKLHIYADDNEDATLLLEPSNWSGGKTAKLMLGTQDFWLKTGNSIGMQFSSPDGFIMQAGGTQTVFIDPGQFEVQGTTTTKNFKMYDASNPPEDGYLLQTDAVGNASWVAPSTLPGSWQVNEGNGIYYQDGNVGIGTIDTYGAMLAVKGKIFATEVEIKHEADWYDYVFEKKYKLRTLGELETFVNKHKHLPDVPSAEEVKENGINLGEMDGVLLKKVEELTLYIIQQQKVIDELQQKVEKLAQEK